MPRIREMFPSGYLAAEDLLGRDVDLTISSVKEEKLHQAGKRSEVKWVLRFVEMEKRKKETDRKALVLVKTNALTIGKLHGGDSDEWAGKRITLYPTTCDAFGDPNTPCIRIRPTIPPDKKEGAND